MTELNLRPFLDCAEILVSQDETERALQLLYNLPGKYRDFPPQEVVMLRKQILSKIMLPYDLLDDKREMPKPDEWSVQFLNSTMRGIQLRLLVEKYNNESIVPHIVEMGPGDFTFAIGMKKEGLRFTYDCFTLNKIAKADFSKSLISNIPNSKAPFIFVAYEVIEHLHHIDEIRQMYDRIDKTPEHVMLSTPKYTFEKGTPNWKIEGIHHLRTYTPREFGTEAMRLFPEYNFEYADNAVMVLVGTLRK